MTISVDSARCPQDHSCPAARVCPTGALVQHSFDAPRVNAAACIGCGKCVRSCLMGAIQAS